MAAGRKQGNLDPRRGVYMISVAAELAGMHPQTLRIYEARGLITPQRSAGKTSADSQADVERLRRIQELTHALGMNLAGVEPDLDLDARAQRIRALAERLQQKATELELEM